MATVFKNLLSNDVATTRTLLNEAIPITGTIVSGTYNDLNVRNYAHGMFQSVYDYPILSSSANHIFDLTYGYSAVVNNAANSMNDKKRNIYNQMAQVLVGYDETGSIRRFDRDGDLTGGDKLDACVFISYARLLAKDEIKKGSYTLTLQNDAAPGLVTLGDYGADNDYRVNSPAGEYGVLYTASSPITAGSGVGLIYYQAGIVVLTASVNIIESASFFTGSTTLTTGVDAWNISGTCDYIRHIWDNDLFNNTTELNSTIYFCRANNNEFNYSANPTYLSGSRINVKQTRDDNPVSYITTVGLYSADNELLAVAKISEPLKKDPTNELTLRVRLDY
ncbi:MAG: hypothetical protein CMB97_01820 [Flavobacteriaceae bacterium]|nr:hypothetical protein [Flavobacteriaceae bacterium]